MPILVPKLLPFQQIGGVQAMLDFARANNDRLRVLLADEQGLGKTPQVLRALKLRPHRKPRLVVCPASLRINWEREAVKFAGMQAMLLTGVKPDALVSEMRRAHLLVTGYDTLHYWLRVLQKAGIQALAGDEIQEICGIYSKRSKAFRELAQGVPDVYAMSGTPLLNNPSELWPIISTLWPDEFDSIFDYMGLYCEDSDNQGGRWKWKGARNLQNLNARLRRCGMIRRTTAEVLPQLPAKRRIVLPLPLSDPKEYERAEREFIPWLASWDPARAKRAERAIQFAKFSYMKKLAAELKLPAVMEWIDTWLQGSKDQKIIVFGVHREAVLDKLYERYKSTAVRIVGGMTDNQRQIAQDAFKSDKGVRVLIGQIRAGGVGLNLVEARVCLFVELAWNPAAHKQAEKRANRIGSKWPLDVVYGIAAGTLEEKLAQIIDRKQKYSDRILDGKARTVDSLNLLDELTKAILQDSKRGLLK